MAMVRAGRNRPKARRKRPRMCELSEAGVQHEPWGKESERDDKNAIPQVHDNRCLQARIL